MAKRGKIAVAESIAAAAPAASSPFGTADFASRRFAMRESGLYQRSLDGDNSDLWLSGPFEVLAETRDEASTSWGLIVRWLDRDQRQHEAAIARRDLAGDGGAVRERLADGGLALNPSKRAREAFIAYLSACTPSSRARCVPSIGWHVVGGSRVFVLPGEVFGRAAERVILQQPDALPEAFCRSGTISEWRDRVAALCVGNVLLLLVVSAAFAGPLLELMGEPGGGFHLRGPSRSGKSTALRAAASVWGGTPHEGAKGFESSWRATDNGLETVAAARSDALLCLDEIGQVDPRVVGDIVYMLPNGSGKVRSRRDGLQRPVVRFRIMFLSTGETGLNDLNTFAGKETKAGQEVRLVDVRVDGAEAAGVFSVLHGCTSAGTLAERLSEAVRSHYGVAAPAYLEYLTTALSNNAASFISDLRMRVERLASALCPPDVSGQVRSVARRFALVGVAGALASEAAITGWQRGLAEDAARICFADWLAERGTSGAREDALAVTRLRDFIGRHGSARFEEWRERAENDPASQVDPESAAPGGRPVLQRAGWRRWNVDPDERTGAWRYFLLPDAMKEALGSLDIRSANAALIAAGVLIAGRDGKNAGLHRPPGSKKARLYEIDASVLCADGGGCT